MRVGLKLWSSDDNYRERAETLFSENVYDYIELMVVSGSASVSLAAGKSSGSNLNDFVRDVEFIKTRILS